MSGTSVLLWAMAIVLGAVVVLVIATAAGRVVRQARHRRRERLRDELRPTVVAVLSDPDAPPPDDLPDGGRRDDLFEVLAFDYLAKVRGESRDALVRVLVERGTVDAAERRLGRPGVVGRIAAAELLGRCGLARSRGPLEALLDHHSADVRAAAVRALGRLHDAAAVPTLLDAAEPGRSVPAAIVAQSLVRIGPSAIPTLDAAARRPDDASRSVAVAVLGLQRAVTAVPTLVDVLGGDDVASVRAYAARALGQIGDPRAVGPLARAATDDTAISAPAAAALGELGDRRGVAALTNLVGDPRHDVATAAALALTRCGPAGFEALTGIAGTGGPAADHAVAALARSRLGDAAPRQEDAS